MSSGVARASSGLSSCAGGWEKEPRLSFWRRSNSACCSAGSLGGDGPGEKCEAMGALASRLDSESVRAVERRRWARDCGSPR